MTPEQDRMLRETLQLSQDNNRMLHAMRRNARLGAVVKFIFYFLILVVAPLWVYSTYLAPIIQNLQQEMAQIQGTNEKAQSQFTAMQDAWRSFESKIPGFKTATSTAQ